MVLNNVTIILKIKCPQVKVFLMYILNHNDSVKCIVILQTKLFNFYEMRSL